MIDQYLLLSFPLAAIRLTDAVPDAAFDFVVKYL